MLAVLIGHFSFLLRLEVIEFECRFRLTSSKLFSWEQHLRGEHRQQQTRGAEQPAASTWVPNWQPAFSQSVWSTCSLRLVSQDRLLGTTAPGSTRPPYFRPPQQLSYATTWQSGVLHWKHLDWTKPQATCFRETS